MFEGEGVVNVARAVRSLTFGEVGETAWAWI
jgi:hypothetical protein